MAWKRGEETRKIADEATAVGGEIMKRVGSRETEREAHAHIHMRARQ